MTLDEAIQMTRGCAEMLEFDPMHGEPTPPHRLEYEQAQAIRMVLAKLEKYRGAIQENWIPCSEILPEESGRVLVFIKTGYITVVNYSSKHRQFNNFDCLGFNNKNAFDNVIAWMPLPEAYKEELND